MSEIEHLQRSEIVYKLLTLLCKVSSHGSCAVQCHSHKTNPECSNNLHVLLNVNNSEWHFATL